ncbi:hypothetical protein RR48_06026 [Papilio machaon]|uniref:Uncharacterized protein n=1 Tax=Papilio machaon TaxID=76193 RepID=A0A194RJF6_PAPMA|nr:hypothetical protein RR48_06026 [Papilio machaon]
MNDEAMTSPMLERQSSMSSVYWWVTLIAVCSAEKWRFPEKTARSARIDSKVKFTEPSINSNQNFLPNRGNIPNNAVPNDLIDQAASQNFYYQPGPGQYGDVVQPLQGQKVPFLMHQTSDKELVKPVHESDGTLDSLDRCMCRQKRDCMQRLTNAHVCGPNMKLCCFTDNNLSAVNRAEYFNELVDERPMLLPGRAPNSGPFPPPPDSVLTGAGKYAPGRAPDAMLLAALDMYRDQPAPTRPRHDPLLSTPNHVPAPQLNRPVFIGTGGPNALHRAGTHMVSKNNYILANNAKRPLLVGPEGPSGVVGPYRIGPQSLHPKPLVINDERPELTNPNGQNYEGSLIPYSLQQDLHPSQSAQRPILVGPGGPTGVIGPEYNQRPILVGPGGPTGIIGPRRPILVGLGGQSGMIGPNYMPTAKPGIRRPVLVGPGGPTGVIGPYRIYFK